LTGAWVFRVFVVPPAVFADHGGWSGWLHGKKTGISS